LASRTWTQTANATTDIAEAADPNGFLIYYPKTGLIYGVTGTTTVFGYDPTGSAAWADYTVAPLSAGARALVHSKDDILYVPYDNKIAKNDNGTWTAVALTLPTHLKITSIAEYGNALAIACAPLSGIGESIVYLWNRDETTTVLSQSIPWGEGNLTILEEIEGFLIGVSYIGIFNATAATNFEQKAVFKYYAGSKPITFKELVNETTFDNSPNDIPLAKQKVNNYLYFSMKITLNGVIQHGIWKIGRTKSGTFSLVMDRTWNNDVVPVAADEVFSFILVGDYMFIAYSDGGTQDVSKTDDAATFTATAVYETIILDFDDSSITKKLLSVTVMSEALPAAGQIVVKYKKEAETSFTTILTNTTDNSVRKTAINIESSGDQLPTFKELTLRVESTGKAVITGLKIKAEVIFDDIIN